MKRRQTRETQKLNSAWKLMRLGDVFEQRTQRGSAGLPVLSVTMDKGLVARDSVEKKMKQSLPPEESLLVQPGDIVYNTMRMWQGAVAYSDREGVVSPAYVVCRPKKDLVDGQFMHCLFKSREGQNKLQAFSHGLTADRLRLYFDDFSEIPFHLPPLSEQQRIAGVLDTWNDALRMLEHLISAKERRRRGLVQSIVVSKLESKNLKNRWRKIQLGSLVTRVTRRNTEGNLNVLTTSAQRGLIRQRDYFSKDIASSDLSNYYLLRRGEFAYNRSSSDGYPFGAIKRLDHFECGVLSTLNLCFSITTEEVDSDFLLICFESGMLNHGLNGICQEGARNHGLLNVTSDDFFSLPLAIPPLPEQRRIANILRTADSELHLLRQQHAALATQKRGLMQLLLTDNKRARV
jgi:type I restriction enzyme S subunit